MLPPHMWFPNLRSSSLHLLLMKATAGEYSINYGCAVEWCLGVSAWQHILIFALHNSCMFELVCRTGLVHGLKRRIQDLKQTLKKAIHLYSCIHDTTMTRSVAPRGDNTSYVTSTRWSIYPATQTCCCWPPGPVSLIFWFGLLHNRQT